MEDKIEISKVNAIKAYNLAEGETKKALLNLIGADVLENPKNLKSFNDVLKFHNISDQDWKSKITYLEKSEIYLLKFRLILKAINGDWKADFVNRNQYKYGLWFEKKALVWSVGLDFGWRAVSRLPGCFYFKSKELAYYVWEQFHQEFVDYLDAQ
jgi:hypothetical protein